MSKEEMFKKVNVNSSAVALGHLIGATGARLVRDEFLLSAGVSLCLPMMSRMLAVFASW